jgi:hypothetical protein
MRFKNLTTFALLFVLSFFIVHDYVYAAHSDEHCSATEYIVEFDTPQSHGDICDIHFEYHQSYLLSQKVILARIDYKIIPNKIDKESYNFKTHLKFYKPPIS